MKVLYFAWLRERLDRDQEEIELPAHVETVGDCIQWLRSRDEASELALAKPELVKTALDARLVGHQTPLGSARVLALFPPMTGG